MSRNGFLTSWTGMLKALESRFAPAYYDDPSSTLFKLQQQGFVNDYLMEFERLAYRIVGLAPSFLLSCFVSGLTLDLCHIVQASPSTLFVDTSRSPGQAPGNQTPWPPSKLLLPTITSLPSTPKPQLSFSQTKHNPSPKNPLRTSHLRRNGSSA